MRRHLCERPISRGARGNRARAPQAAAALRSQLAYPVDAGGSRAAKPSAWRSRMRLKRFGPIGDWQRAEVAADILRGRAMPVRGYVTLAHVSTAELATAALHNDLLDDVAILKISVADDGRLSGEIKNFYH